MQATLIKEHILFDILYGKFVAADFDSFCRQVNDARDAAVTNNK